MKWYAKRIIQEPTDGSTQLIRKFAWLPVLIAGQKVWMETYEVLQVWEVKRTTVRIEEKDIVFAIGRWINLSKRIIE
jgi:hypothetical protein